MRRTAFRRLFNERPITWLLRDEFSDTRAAGSVNGTMATPGPGTRTISDDTDTATAITAGKITVTALGTPQFGKPGMVHADAPIVRTPGQIVVFGVDTNSPKVGLVSSTTLTTGSNWRQAIGATTTTITLYEGFTGPTLAAKTSAVQYSLIIALRATGAVYFLTGGTEFPAPVMIWASANNSSSPLYAAMAAINSSGRVIEDFVRAPISVWLPAPLVSDGFGSTFGTSDGLGHAEGVSGGTGSGGGNVTLTQQVGTWTVSSSKAAAATLSGGVAVATVPLSTADVFAKVKVTRSAGAGGLTLRWTDSSNYLYAEHDGTNAYLKQVLSGSTTTLITAAATYSAGAEIVVDLSGVNGRLYYNNALVGSTASINSGLTATLHGVRSTDTGGIQLDDLCIYAKGTGGEYNVPLNRYVV